MQLKTKLFQIQSINKMLLFDYMYIYFSNSHEENKSIIRVICPKDLRYLV